MSKINFIIIVVIATTLLSCRAIFNGAVAPNQCKKCEIINNATGEVIWSVEGCGSENTLLLEKSKQEAYDRSRTGNNLCDLEVKCTSWRKDPEAEQ